MRAAATTNDTVEHPAPHRDRVALWTLWAGIAGAPLAWTSLLLLAFAFSAHGCFPGDTPLEVPIWGGLHRGLAFLCAAAAAVAVAALALSYRSWARTRSEKPGSGHQLISVGDGRTRFLAMCGLLSSTLFLGGILFETIALLLSPICRG